MLQPTYDYMIIERYKEMTSDLILPDSADDPKKGDLFTVKAVGPGWWDNGKRVKPDVRVGDVVAIIGMIQQIVYKGEKVFLARASEVVAADKDAKPSRILKIAS